MQKAYLIFFIISIFGVRNVQAQCNYISDSSYFLPSVIMQSDIVNTNPLNFNDSTKQIKITSIDWETYTVKINKPIWLPRFNMTYQNSTIAKWQLYGVGMNSNNINFALQLTEQLNLTTFKFKIQFSQDTNSLKEGFKVNNQIGFRNPFINYRPLWNGNRIFHITNNENTDGSKIFINDINGRGIINVKANNLKKGDHLRMYDFGGLGNIGLIVEDVNGDNLTTNDINGRKISKDALYADKTSIIQTIPKVINIDTNTINSGYLSWFSGSLYKVNGSYLTMLPLYNDKGPQGFAISSSANFINWSIAVKDTNYSMPYWAVDDKNVCFPRPSDVKINNICYLPFSTFKKGSNVIRIGLMKVKYDSKNNAQFNLSDSYFKTRELQTDSLTMYRYASFCKFKDRIFVALEIQIGKVWYIKIYNSSNLDSLKLSEELQALTYNKSNTMLSSWNSEENDGLTGCCMFTYKENLYLMAEGITQKEDFIYGNMSNTIGLYIWNENKGKFEENYTNPLLINPNLSGWDEFASGHLGMISVLNDNDELKGLLTVTSANLSWTYKVLPIILNPCSFEEIKEFKLKNNLK